MRTNTMLSYTLLLASIGLCNNLNAQTIGYEWATSASGSGTDIGQRVTTDELGNIYVTGYFLGDSISFGSITLTKDPVSIGSSAIFIVKYDPYGNVLWAKSAGGNDDDTSNGIATDAMGNVFITGGFQSDTITFDTTLLINASTASSEDVFIVKYDTNGSVVWAKSGAGSGASQIDVGYGIATDGIGNVYVSGYFRSQSLTFGSITLNGAAQADIFIVKYSADGDVLWARSEAGSAGEYSTGVATDMNGNFYITGHFYGNSITIGSTTLTNANNTYKPFIAKYDSDGNPLWAKGGGGIANDRSLDIATDATGNVFITGWYEGFPVSFGSITLPYSSGKDLFIVKYDPDGNELWANNASTTSNEEGHGIATDLTGNVYLTGYFIAPTINFGSISLSGSGGSNIFIVKYDANGNVVWARTADGVDDEQGNGIATIGEDHVVITGSFDSASLQFGSNTLTNVGPDDVFVAKINWITNVGVDETFASEGLHAYPNPFSAHINLRTAEPLKNASLKIINSLGQTIKEANHINGSTITVDRDNLPSGLYIILITQNNVSMASMRVEVMDQHNR